jgi:hypothetical protein
MPSRLYRRGTGSSSRERLSREAQACPSAGVAVWDFSLATGEALFDLIVAVRIGAFDGRRPHAGALAWPRMAAALPPGGRVVADGVAWIEFVEFRPQGLTLRPVPK